MWDVAKVLLSKKFIVLNYYIMEKNGLNQEPRRNATQIKIQSKQEEMINIREEVTEIKNRKLMKKNQ